MPASVKIIYDYFARLGLEQQIADIYLSLHTHGPQTMSELSRSAHVERTRIYRLLDKLRATNLIEVESHYKRGIIRAAPITNLHILISQKEQELKALQDGFGLIERTLTQDALMSPATRVQFYQGAEGYKQMLWNESAAKAEVLCITYEIAQGKTNVAFFNRYVDRANHNDVHYREIHGDAFHESSKVWYAAHANHRLAHYESRYVSNAVFPITYSVEVYDDVVAYFNWKNGEIFGIEIYNTDIANGQRQFFELLWQRAETEQGSHHIHWR